MHPPRRAGVGTSSGKTIVFRLFCRRNREGEGPARPDTPDGDSSSSRARVNTHVSRTRRNRGRLAALWLRWSTASVSRPSRGPSSYGGDNGSVLFPPPHDLLFSGPRVDRACCRVTGSRATRVYRLKRGRRFRQQPRERDVKSAPEASGHPFVRGGFFLSRYSVLHYEFFCTSVRQVRLDVRPYGLWLLSSTLHDHKDLRLEKCRIKTIWGYWTQNVNRTTGSRRTFEII